MGEEPSISVFRPDRPGIRKVLGDLEAEIMELIWSRPAEAGTTVRDVFEVLYERRHLAYTTVMNTMTRLARKNLLRAEKQDQAYVYYPTMTQEAFVSRFVDQVLEGLLVSFSGLTLERIDALGDTRAAARARQLLEQIAQRRAGEEGDAGDAEGDHEAEADRQNHQGQQGQKGQQRRQGRRGKSDS